MAAYTFDVFDPRRLRAHIGEWAGYGSKRGPAFLGRRGAMYDNDLRMVLGADTSGARVQLGGGCAGSSIRGRSVIGG